MKRGGPPRRKTPLRSRTGLKTYTQLHSRTRLKPVNYRRQWRRKKEGLVYGPYHRWTGTQPCLVLNADCWGQISGHHVKPVGPGGQDYGNEVPLCEFHHLHELPSMGQQAFEEKHGVRLEAAAKQLAATYPGKDWEK